MHFGSNATSRIVGRDPLSPTKSFRFDINGYFKGIKEEKSPKQECYFLKDDKSARTRNTEDNSQREGVSQKFSETTCFKDLMNQELGLSSLLLDAKSSKKCIETNETKYSKSAFEGLKENRLRTTQ